MKKLFKTTSLLFLSVLLFSFQSIDESTITESFPPGKWVKLGMRKVSKGADHDVLMVTANKGRFTKLKFKVTHSPVHISNIRIVFANGESQNFIINKNFPKGVSSRAIDLEGNKRIINKIVFNYHTKFYAKGKARIHVYGKH